MAVGQMEVLEVKEGKVGRKWPRFVDKLWIDASAIAEEVTPAHAGVAQGVR
jgi:hypothetical protein